MINFQKKWDCGIEVAKKEVKAEMADKIVCDKCTAEFDKVKSLSTHKKKKHDSREYCCPEPSCDVNVVGMKKLHDHIRKHKKIECNICGINILRTTLSRHLKICTGPKKPKGWLKKCDIKGCDYRTLNGSNLKKHNKKMHTLIQCNIPGCQFEANTLKRVEMHKRRVHGIRNKLVTQHRCGWCVFSSSRKANLTKHEQSCCERRRLEAIVCVL